MTSDFNGDYEEYYRLEMWRRVVWYIFTMFRRDMLPLCCLAYFIMTIQASKLCLLQVSCLTHSSTLKMEATCSSYTEVDFQRTTRRYTPEDRTLHDHRCENLKLYTAVWIFIKFDIGVFTWTLPNNSNLDYNQRTTKHFNIHDGLISGLTR
jgi:hypothetical protein